MIHIAVVEDSEQDAKVLLSYLDQYQIENSCKFKISRFRDGDEVALQYKGGFDIILMDIEMMFMDGMSAAEEIRRVDEQVTIIFITNSPQYAIKGYAVNALDYVLKPVSYYAFSQRIHRALKQLENHQKNYISVSCADGVHRLDVHELYFVEIHNHELLFHTSQGLLASNGSLRELEEKLPESAFFRTSKGYLVNLEYVDNIMKEDAVVHGERVQISHARRKDFLAALNHYMGEAL